MSHYKINPKDLFFILQEQLDYGSLCDLDRYKHLNQKALDMLVTEAIGFAKGVIAPLQEIGEKEGVQFQNNQVSCPRAFQKAFKQYGADGWTAAARDTQYGGQGFPHMMRIVINDLMYGACQAFNMAPSLTHGAAHLIESFGSDWLKQTFVPKMFSGIWSGTMCLTEPEAGSDLGTIQTTAIPHQDTYLIKGSKLFISWGDHDLCDNIIHLLLARIEGAPPGVAGISLFVVPKLRVNPDGSLGQPNGVVCTGIEQKLGLHASPTCTLDFGSKSNCVGYLCGSANKGLAHMFQMMNSARINTGVSGMSIASCAYQNALAYTKQRKQGCDIGERNGEQVRLIKHPDVRRMLLWMKAQVDGMRSMIYSCALWQDLALEMSAGPEKEHYANLVNFMTPIIKAYCSEWGFRVCETAIQCLGGYGYCKDYPLEQYLRDVKILSLYEGTNGIQSLDLMGRKMNIRRGACYQSYHQEIECFCRDNVSHPGLQRQIKQLAKVAHQARQTTKVMLKLQSTEPRQWAARTYPMLNAFGQISMAWRLLDMARIAWKRSQDDTPKHHYVSGKVFQAKFFVKHILPKTETVLEICAKHGREIIDMPDRAF
jgi:alkylation response protein AidB-like acyl-CoA dehydrogenase